ncbi:MAG TPA: DMT family transporter [Chloroflexia bacterium]|nr:DMT family transporter [Chloroflexia bacterium]
MKSRDIGLLLLLGALWGASFMFIKVILREVAPLTLVGYRIGLGALGLLAFFAVDQWRRRRAGETPVPFPWRRIIGPGLILALLNGIVPYIAITWGETAISSGDAAILNATTPLFTAIILGLLGSRAGNERMTLAKGVGLVVGFAGVALLVSGGAPQAGVSGADAWWGHGAVLLASASYAVASLYARRAFRGLPVIYPALAQLTSAALLLLPFTLSDPPQHPLSPATIGSLLVLGLGGTGLAYLIYFQLLARVGATRTVIVTYLLPCTALFYGALLLNEPVGVTALGGLVLVLLGIAITGGVFGQLQARRAAKAQQVEAS